MAVRSGYERIRRMLTYREAVPAMKAELCQAETASHRREESRCSHLAEVSRCAMVLSFNAN